MLKKLLVVAVVATVASISLASSASAADRWNRYGSTCSPRSSSHTYYFPQQNQMLIEQRSGSSSYFYSSPIQQFGAPGINYQGYYNSTFDLYGSGVYQRPARQGPLW